MRCACHPVTNEARESHSTNSNALAAVHWIRLDPIPKSRGSLKAFHWHTRSCFHRATNPESRHLTKELHQMLSPMESLPPGFCSGISLDEKPIVEVHRP